MDDEAEWEPPVVVWSPADWDAALAQGWGVCCFCDKPSDERRFAVALQIQRAWTPYGVETRYAHVECLRRAMHTDHKLN